MAYFSWYNQELLGKTENLSFEWRPKSFDFTKNLSFRVKINLSPILDYMQSSQKLLKASEKLLNYIWITAD